jgi:hypothetical protein
MNIVSDALTTRAKAKKQSEHLHGLFQALQGPNF